jgi:hypothetical protein
MAIGTIAAIALGAGAIGSAVIGSGATKSAANAATNAADTSAAVQREQLGAAQTALNPFIAAGQPASANINALLGLGGNPAAANQAFDQYRGSTGYDFRLNQGLDAVNSGYAGAGTIKSGAAMKGISDYGQGMASQEFGNYLNALGNQQALGLSGASALAGVGQNYANSIGNINSNKADAIGNAALAGAANTNSLISGLTAGIFKYGVK